MANSFYYGENETRELKSIRRAIAKIERSSLSYLQKIESKVQAIHKHSLDSADLEEAYFMVTMDAASAIGKLYYLYNVHISEGWFGRAKFVKESYTKEMHTAFMAKLPEIRKMKKQLQRLELLANANFSESMNEEIRLLSRKVYDFSMN